MIKIDDLFLVFNAILTVFEISAEDVRDTEV